MEPACPLVLASASPRRRALLEQAGLTFAVHPVEEAEGPCAEGADPRAHALASAEAKARAGSLARPDALVLGADTVVALDGRALGKPADRADARRMLLALSGRTHEVHTGVALAQGGEVLVTDAVTTRVTFRDLSTDEVEAYLATGEALDKAGAYGIQGRAALLVRAIDGCYFNVVGLPLSRTWELLSQAEELVRKRGGGSQC
jgi:septum formation protein